MAEKDEKMVFMGNDEYNDYLRRVFKLFDFEGNHVIDLEVYKMLFKTLGHTINGAVIAKMEKRLENEGLDGVPYQDFVQKFTSIFPVGNVKEDLVYAFEQASQDGCITKESLTKANEEAQLGFTPEEIENIIKEYDVSHDGKIQFQEIANRFLTDDVKVEFNYEGMEPVIRKEEEPEDI